MVGNILTIVSKMVSDEGNVGSLKTACRHLRASSAQEAKTPSSPILTAAEEKTTPIPCKPHLL